MKVIPYTLDPEDETGARCESLEGNLKCHRRKGHSTATKTIKVEEDGRETEIFINHRAVAGGNFYTW